MRVFVLASNKTSLQQHPSGLCYLDSATQVKEKMTDPFNVKIKIELEPWNIRARKALFFHTMKQSPGEGNDLPQAINLGQEPRFTDSQFSFLSIHK